MTSAPHLPFSAMATPAATAAPDAFAASKKVLTNMGLPPELAPELPVVVRVGLQGNPALVSAVAGVPTTAGIVDRHAIGLMKALELAQSLNKPSYVIYHIQIMILPDPANNSSLAQSAREELHNWPLTDLQNRAHHFANSFRLALYKTLRWETPTECAARIAATTPTNPFKDPKDIWDAVRQVCGSSPRSPTPP